MRWPSMALAQAARRVAWAAPLGVMLPVWVGLTDALQRGEHATLGGLWGGLARGMLGWGWAPPLIAAALAAASLQSSGQWRALEVLGYAPRGILARLAVSALPLALVCGALAWVAPSEPLYDALHVPHIGVEAGGDAWRVPMGDGRAVRLDWDALDARLLGADAPTLRPGRAWADARRVWIGPMGALMMACGLGGWARAPLEARAGRVLGPTLWRLVALVGGFALADTLTGLMVQAQSVSVSAGVAVLATCALVAGGIGWAHTRRSGMCA